MLIRESWLLGLEPGGLLREILSFSSTQGGADTPARITGDGYKNGGEVNSTRRHSGMDVDPSGRDNHSGPGRFSRTKKTELREALWVTETTAGGPLIYQQREQKTGFASLYNMKKEIRVEV